MIRYLQYLWSENPENLKIAKVAIFRRDFEIGHLLRVLAYLPLPKNRKSRFGQDFAQNRANITSVGVLGLIF